MKLNKSELRKLILESVLDDIDNIIEDLFIGLKLPEGKLDAYQQETVGRAKAQLKTKMSNEPFYIAEALKVSKRGINEILLFLADMDIRIL